MEDLQTVVQGIRERNARVEREKAWEVSWTRKLSILALTYACAATLLGIIGNHPFLLNALIPAAGYLLSTFSLPWAKNRWMKRYSLQKRAH